MCPVYNNCNIHFKCSLCTIIVIHFECTHHKSKSNTYNNCTILIICAQCTIIVQHWYCLKIVCKIKVTFVHLFNNFLCSSLWQQKFNLVYNNSTWCTSNVVFTLKVPGAHSVFSSVGTAVQSGCFGCLKFEKFSNLFANIVVCEHVG